MSKRKKVIGVMGSSHGEIPNVALTLGYNVGKAIAKSGSILLTGGTLGVPEQAVLGANELGGTTIAISPAVNMQEHTTKYNQSDKSNIYVFTGLGDFGRNLFNVRTADALIYICGGMGTLSELTMAYAEGKLIGILTNSGGISENAEHIIKLTGKIPKNVVIYDTDPSTLVDKLLEKYL